MKKKEKGQYSKSIFVFSGGKPLFINSFQRLINNAAYEKPITDILLINPIRGSLEQVNIVMIL